MGVWQGGGVFVVTYQDYLSLTSFFFEFSSTDETFSYDTISTRRFPEKGGTTIITREDRGREEREIER